MAVPLEVSTGLIWPHPDVFQKACDVLAFTPTADMFGSQANHQVPWYFSTDDSETEEAGTDVFSSSWVAESAPYFCPPWTEIVRCWRKSWRKVSPA